MGRRGESALNGSAGVALEGLSLAEKFPLGLPRAALPEHIAIIMDGNGRWARARDLPRHAGHRRGLEAARKVVEAASEIGLRYLTMFGFSCENWKRPVAEVSELMKLLRLYLHGEIERFQHQSVRFQVIGERQILEQDIVALIEQAEEQTCQNRGMTLSLALNYGSQQELVAAVRRIVSSCQSGYLASEDIDERLIANHLFTSGIPSPDLIIRTGGELRLSNFLLWQSAYAELLFTETLWPDFTEWHLREAIGEFQRRERRFGSSHADKTNDRQQNP